MRSQFTGRVTIVTVLFTEAIVIVAVVVADCIATTTVVHQQTFVVIVSTKYATIVIAIAAFTTISTVVDFPKLGDAILVYVTVRITHLTCCSSSFPLTGPNQYPLS